VQKNYCKRGREKQAEQDMQDMQTYDLKYRFYILKHVNWNVQWPISHLDSLGDYYITIIYFVHVFIQG